MRKFTGKGVMRADEGTRFTYKGKKIYHFMVRSCIHSVSVLIFSPYLLQKVVGMLVVPAMSCTQHAHKVLHAIIRSSLPALNRPPARHCHAHHRAQAHSRSIPSCMRRA